MLQLSYHTKSNRRLPIAMNSITQDMRYRQSLLKYSEKYGVTKAAIKYKTNRQYIYRWRRRYDGTLESLRDMSRPAWPSKPTQRRRDEADPRYASTQPQLRSGRILGKAEAARLHAKRYRAIQGVEKAGRNGRQAKESEVYCQAIRADVIPR